MEDKKSRFIIIVLVLLGMTWVGYRMRLEEEAVREADKEADRYFERLDSLKGDTL